MYKHVEKYDFYGLKRQIFLNSIARIYRPISTCLVKGPTPKLWRILINRAFKCC